MSTTRRVLILIWSIIALLRLEAQDDPLDQYRAQRMSVQLQQTFLGATLDGSSAQLGAAQNNSDWFPFRGFDLITEREFYAMTDHPELVDRYDELARQRSTAYLTTGGIAAAGVILIVTAAYVWPNAGAYEYPFNFGLGTGGSGVGTVVSLIGLALIPVSLLPLLHLPPDRTINYPAALDIAEEYNHKLRITLHIAQ